MSTLTAYREWLSTAQSCLDGALPPADTGQFRLDGPVRLPLVGLPSSKEIYRFYESRFKHVRNCRLVPQRQELYTRSIQQIYYAYVAVERHRRSCGIVSDLRVPVEHLLSALRLIEETRDFDHAHPIHGLEWYPLGATEAHMPPKDSWFYFKLASIHPCLLLSVQVLRMSFPDCSGFWDECDEGLGRDKWRLQFVLDSEKAHQAALPLYAPLRSDIIGSAVPRDVDRPA